MADIATEFLNSIPAQLRFVGICGVAAALTVKFLWANYFSDRAVLENKRRELEVIKLGLEIEKLTDGKKSAELRLLKDRTLKELNEYYEAKAERARRFKSSTKEFLQLYAARLRAVGRWPDYFGLGAFGGFVLTAFVLLYVWFRVETWTLADIKGMLWFSGFMASFCSIVGGGAAIFIPSEKRYGNLFSGVIGVALFAQAGIWFFVMLARHHWIPVRV